MRRASICTAATIACEWRNPGKQTIIEDPFPRAMRSNQSRPIAIDPNRRTEIVESLRFRYPWRDYQARVLDAVDLYLADRRLHIVAAPGSGKTTLGLEIFRRLGEPAVVLSPTRVIRNQWINRLQDYCPRDSKFPPDWTSRALDKPGFLTSITYQALHTKYRQSILDTKNEAETDDEVAAQEESEIRTAAIDTEEIDSLITMLRDSGAKTLVLDEAHHLRAEWWKALKMVVDAIEGMVVVSLTATPPYDSSTAGWKRYEDLCGVIDEEISVPELVKAGTLCPHQDFVWTVVPTEYERRYLDEYYANVRAAVDRFRADDILESAIRSNRWIDAADFAVDDIAAEPEIAIALLAYLKAKNLTLPPLLLSALDLEPRDIPALGDYWWQVLIGAYLYKDSGWPDDHRLNDHRKKIARALREKNLLRNRQLQLSDARLVKRHMTQSSAKVQACIDIYRCERDLRKNKLRQVILTDYIRDQGVRTQDEDQSDVLGAWPIFRAMAEQLDGTERCKCALLTGRLVVLHESVAAGIANQITFRPLQQLDEFVIVDSTARNPVTILTELLEAGAIHVLTGTRALLGEGWDAPCINSLILASSVGSYMLTNQMRGRAIRIDKRNPEKVASIWHIVAIVLDRKLLDFAQERRLFWPGLADFRELDNRFATFVGLHESAPQIENNLLRLKLPYIRRKRNYVTGAEHLAFEKHYFRSAYALETTNHTMIDRLYRIDEVKNRWDHALTSATGGYVVPSVSSESPPSARMFHFRRTLFYFVLVAIGTFFAAAQVMLAFSREISLILAASLLWSLPKFLVAARLFFKHLPVDGTIHQIGLAVRDTLCATGLIENSAARLKVKSLSSGGDVYVNLDGGTFHEKSVFADCMEELLGPIENPRYLLVRHGKTLGFRRKDFHAVPTRIGAKKEYATILHQAWKKYVGDAELIYTRATETRKTLLAARARAFSGGTRSAAKRIDRWV